MTVDVSAVYITAVQAALRDELMRTMGVGTSVYPDPSYLCLKSVRLGSPMQGTMRVAGSLPSAKLAFHVSKPTEMGISGSNEGYREDIIVVWFSAQFTPTTFGLVAGSYDVDDFQDLADGAINTLLQRGMSVLRMFVLNVQDVTWGWISNECHIGEFSAYLDTNAESGLEIYARAYFEYVLGTARMEG